MSMAALCLGVRNVLRTALGITGSEPEMALKCDLALQGKPHPAAGQVFYAVHPYQWSTRNGDYDLDELMGVRITVSMKIGVSPKDRTMTALWSTPVTGLDALCRKALLAIHRQQSVRAAVNAIIGATDAIDATPNGFETELWFQQADPEPVPRDDEWFGAEPSVATQAIRGFSVSLTFGLAERVQTIAGAT